MPVLSSGWRPAFVEELAKAIARLRADLSEDEMEIQGRVNPHGAR